MWANAIALWLMIHAIDAKMWLLVLHLVSDLSDNSSKIPVVYMETSVFI